MLFPQYSSHTWGRKTKNNLPGLWSLVNTYKPVPTSNILNSGFDLFFKWVILISYALNLSLLHSFTDIKISISEWQVNLAAHLKRCRINLIEKLTFLSTRSLYISFNYTLYINIFYTERMQRRFIEKLKFFNFINCLRFSLLAEQLGVLKTEISHHDWHNKGIQCYEQCKQTATLTNIFLWEHFTF